MNPNDLMVAAVLARRANEQLFRPISHAEFLRMEQARQARIARREARTERSRQRRAAVRSRVTLLFTPDIVERQAPALRP
jgi:hypothetical protein